MTEEYASAYPRKNFFIQMFTKDISLEDCILDLIDNSIDGFIRSTNLKLSAISKSIFKKNEKKEPRRKELPTIEVYYSEKGLQIHDNCGGIDLDYARTEAFNFGHGPDWKGGYLGVYGVGLKRALFKIGNKFDIESKTVDNGFSCHLVVSDWLKKDRSAEDWRIPLKTQKQARSPEIAGTTISITELHDEVKMRLRGPTIETNLYGSISRTYSFFLQRYVRILLNGKEVDPFNIPIGKPTAGTASYEQLVQDGVKVRIFATVGERDEKGRYNQELAGWYVVCNGRVVLGADKSDVSGWGTPGMGTFQPKYRSFVGVTFFESEDPLLLPWTTTKRSLNRESAIYLRVHNRMKSAARPVISFLNKQYPSEPDEEPIEREISKTVKGTSFGDLMAKKITVFDVPKPRKRIKTTTSVQYDAENEDLDKIRKHLRKPRMGANRIGEYTFRYFLDQEGLS